MNWSGVRELVFLFVWVLALALTFRSYDFALSEDAMIVLRYARNIAGGHGFSWNLGEHPIEGSTPFLWTLMLSLGYLVGLEPALSIFLLNGGFLLLTSILLYHALTGWFGAKPVLGFFGGLLVVVSPLVTYMQYGFSTPVFGFFALAVAVFLARIVVNGEDGHGVYAGFAGCGFILGLIRPGGFVFFALSFLIALVYVRGFSRKWFYRTVFWFFLVPTIAFWLWRWMYFDSFLPHTFLVKSGLFLADFNDSLEFNRLHYRYFYWMLYPFIAGFLICLRGCRRGFVKRVLQVSIPTILFPFTYIFIIQIQNESLRFQTMVLPCVFFLFALSLKEFIDGVKSIRPGFWDLLLLIAFIHPLSDGMGLQFITLIPLYSVYLLGLFSGFRPFFKRSDRRLLVLLTLVVFSFYSFEMHRQYGFRGDFRQLRLVGEKLAPYAGKGYSMLVTEAGYLPYYSGWRTIDALGLNNRFIAEEGLDEDYLDSIRPDIVMFHAFFPFYHEELGGRGMGRTGYNRLVQKMYSYARSRDYELASIIIIDDGYNVYWYWVRKSNPDRASLVRAVSDIPMLEYVDLEFVYLK